MLQEFFIKQYSTLPVLRMELIDGGKYDFDRNDVINKALQDAVVSFTMKNEETGALVISNAKADIKFSMDSGCTDKAVIEYQWKKRDTKNKGVFLGEFEISFNGNIKEDGVDFPEGTLRVPIGEELRIYIN